MPAIYSFAIFAKSEHARKIVSENDVMSENNKMSLTWQVAFAFRATKSKENIAKQKV